MTWESFETTLLVVEALQGLSKMFHATLGVDQGTNHAPAELSKGVKALTISLKTCDMYKLKAKKTKAENDSEVSVESRETRGGRDSGSEDSEANINDDMDAPRTRCW
jgi:hypothetical protein